MTYFPSSAINFSYKAFGQIINADDVNNAYDEIIAIGNELGISPRLSGTWGSGTFATTTAWTSVAARIQNIENGFYSTYNDYVSKSGGSVIVPSLATVKALVLKAATGQSVSLLEIQNASSSPVFTITASGALSGTSAIFSGSIQAATIDGGSA